MTSCFQGGQEGLLVCPGLLGHRGPAGGSRGLRINSQQILFLEVCGDASFALRSGESVSSSGHSHHSGEPIVLLTCSPCGSGGLCFLLWWWFRARTSDL